ncbi:Cys-rich repeat protein [Rhodoblastus acidophilus]|uniref:dickkopf-related protein n=1 Tax=Rhodoblastus acidophilus TaxID=1074 RepID=UPI002225AA74|nr:dickkopf-related protein [Rhodoblastus acidophilus]MCW2283517.1 Cys-rich repeat protein [Rhodoblastus acidophilus]MCW2332377.1 Cys-rich repeat protein [Rhodoblastus acidophilus]
MPAKLLLSAAFALLLSQAAVAQECKEDKDCGSGQVCILAMNPHVCKAPQAAGAPCKRDVVCASGTCDMSAGVCK